MKLRLYALYVCTLLGLSLPLSSVNTVDGIEAVDTKVRVPIGKSYSELKTLDYTNLMRWNTSPSEAKAVARDLAARRGWTGPEWDSLATLWENESGWRSGAVNSSSGACGIAQALPCGKVKNWDDVLSQLDFGLNYIQNNYGSPSNALSFWYSQSPHWY